jgi:hypothetical protein
VTRLVVWGSATPQNRAALGPSTLGLLNPWPIQHDATSATESRRSIRIDRDVGDLFSAVVRFAIGGTTKVDGAAVASFDESRQLQHSGHANSIRGTLVSTAIVIRQQKLLVL